MESIMIDQWGIDLFEVCAGLPNNFFSYSLVDCGTHS